MVAAEVSVRLSDHCLVCLWEVNEATTASRASAWCNRGAGWLVALPVDTPNLIVDRRAMDPLESPGDDTDERSHLSSRLRQYPGWLEWMVRSEAAGLPSSGEVTGKPPGSSAWAPAGLAWAAALARSSRVALRDARPKVLRSIHEQGELAMMWYWGSGVGWAVWILGILMMLLFWGGIAALVIFLVRALGGSRQGHPESAMDTLRRRLAAGEITQEEFERIRKVIQS